MKNKMEIYEKNKCNTFLYNIIGYNTTITFDAWVSIKLDFGLSYYHILAYHVMGTPKKNKKNIYI